MKKVMFFLLVAQVFVSCRNNTSEPLSFSVVEKNQTDFQKCEAGDCPKISLKYLVAEGKNGVSKNINQTLDKHRAGILRISQDNPPAASFENALEHFIADYQKFKSDYPEFPGRYEFLISGTVVGRTSKTEVVRTKYYIYTGGAHGYGATNFNTFSRETGKLLQPEDLFGDLKSFTNYAEQKFREQYEVPKGENINSTGFFFEGDRFSLPNNLAVLENEIVLIYNPYEAAAYANGELELRFPKEKVEQWLKK